MNKFLIVLSFELTNYFKKKSFLITTGIIAAVIAIVLTVPSFVDCSKFIPGLKPKETTSTPAEKTKTKFVLLDENKVIPDKAILEAVFPESEWNVAKDRDEATTLINEDDAVAGFEVKSLTEYNYLVKNTKMTDTAQFQFEEVLRKLYEQQEITKLGYDYKAVNDVYNVQIKSEVAVLGKDSAKNFGYAYVLLMLIYTMIMMYGQLIAMSVTSEKSNRAMEVLVTSTTSNSLIFGKVIAGAMASIAQVTAILGTGILFYNINGEVWNGMLDGLLNIPTELLITFALFGIAGYLLYSLMFGALGALVSKTEDIGTSIGPIMMIFMFTFFLSIFGLNKGDALIIKIASFIPFCAPMVMLVRVAMGSVTNVEVIISFVILVVTIGIVGTLASKIYRNATLMYGNPIKLKNALKWIKK